MLCKSRGKRLVRPVRWPAIDRRWSWIPCSVSRWPSTASPPSLASGSSRCIGWHCSHWWRDICWRNMTRCRLVSRWTWWRALRSDIDGRGSGRCGLQLPSHPSTRRRSCFPAKPLPSSYSRYSVEQVRLTQHLKQNPTIKILHGNTFLENISFKHLPNYTTVQSVAQLFWTIRQRIGFKTCNRLTVDCWRMVIRKSGTNTLVNNYICLNYHRHLIGLYLVPWCIWMSNKLN